MSTASSEPAKEAVSAGMRRIAEVATRPDAEHMLSRLQGRMFKRPIPVRVGRFELRDRLGSGAMGVVFSARDPQLDRLIAVKLVHPGLAEVSEEVSSRLLREAQAMARLHHPNVVRVHDVGFHGDDMFVAMELVDGVSLREWLKQDRRSWKEIVEVFILAGRGLAAAHAAGLVHRDFKPDNVFVAKDGQVFVGDFGLARLNDGIERVPTAPEVERHAVLDDTLTRTGAVLGTPAYMAPEAFAGADAGPLSDQYSLCASLYEALYGVRPFGGNTLGELWLAIAEGRLSPPSELADVGRVPKRVRKIALRGLATRPDERWPSIEALVDQLSRSLGSTRRRVVWAALVVGMSGAAAVGAFGRMGACIGVGDDAQQVWAERQAAVRERMEATELSYASETWTRVDALLGAYADEWSQARTTLCESARSADPASRPAVELGVACLEDRLRDLRALAGVLATADAGVVEKAATSASQLPPIGLCRDSEWLLAGVRPPEDPATRERTTTLRESLAESHANRNAGREERASELLDQVERDAVGLDYGPLMAEIALHRGVAEHRAELPRREAILSDAYFRAASVGHEAVAAEAAAHLAHVLAMDGRLDEARSWVLHGLAALDRSEGSPMLRSHVLGAFSRVEREAGRYDDALAAGQEALRLREQSLGTPHLLVADMITDVGNSYFYKRDRPRTLEHFQRALAMRRELVGDDHPHVARDHHNIGAALARSEEPDDLAQALKHHEIELDIRQRAFGPDHWETAVALRSIANVHWRLRELDRAAELHQQALAVLERHYGVDHIQTAQTLNDLGATYYLQEDLVRAETYYRRALEIQQEALGPEHVDHALPLKNLGEVYSKRGQHDLAIDHIRRGLGLAERTYGANEPDLAWYATALGRSLRRAGRHEQAVAVLERTLGLAGLLDDEISAAEPRFELAIALWESDPDRKRARELAAVARSTWKAGGYRYRVHLERIESWMAEVGIEG